MNLELHIYVVLLGPLGIDRLVFDILALPLGNHTNFGGNCRWQIKLVLRFPKGREVQL